ncbi:hypothetical protein HRI_002316900 [Hibiscus trionum]|uniref:Uncharacterized protein n=1 Tax=Hibiscus trionum TaxID=183268 RepID=A0A9W7I015_HIBTR|nr:hypothetical protein HRI_002316900 [Hibiscus trionum]
MKAVNSAAATICGSVKGVKARLGSWEGSVDFTVFPMDDFDVVLGIDFMRKAQVIPVPVASCLVFLGDCPGVVSTTFLPRSGNKMLSAMQFKKGGEERGTFFCCVTYSTWRVNPRRGTK